MRKALTEKLHYIATRSLAAPLRPTGRIGAAEQVLGAFTSVIDAQMHLGLHRGEPGQINRVRKLSGKNELLVLEWTTPERCIRQSISPIDRMRGNPCDCGCNGREHGPDRVFLLLVDEVRAAEKGEDIGGVLGDALLAEEAHARSRRLRND